MDDFRFTLWEATITGLCSTSFCSESLEISPILDSLLGLVSIFYSYNIIVPFCPTSTPLRNLSQAYIIMRLNRFWTVKKIQTIGD